MSYFLLDLNWSVVAFVVSIFCMVNVISLLGIPLQHKKTHHTYNTFIRPLYNTKFIQHKKYNIRWKFWARFQRYCAVARIEVQKCTTKIIEMSSFIRGMYIEIYCIQNKTIHCNAHFEGSILILWCYGVTTVVLRSPFQNMFIQYAYNKKFIQKKINNTTIQHAYQKLIWKEKLDFIEVTKGDI